MEDSTKIGICAGLIAIFIFATFAVFFEAGEKKGMLIQENKMLKMQILDLNSELKRRNKMKQDILNIDYFLQQQFNTKYIKYKNQNKKLRDLH